MHSVTWTSRLPALPSSLLPCSSTPRLTECLPTCWPALLQARDARMQILDVMNEAISEPRAGSARAPKIVSFEIPMDKIGEVIGPKGKVINLIQQETGADVGVTDGGMIGVVTIGCKDGEKVEDAKQRIELILDPPTAEVGVYPGKVVNITKFGAFINILPGRDGLLHIWRVPGAGKRVDRVEDVFSLNDSVTVRVDDVDPQGKVSLSMVGGDGPEGGASDDVSDGAGPAASRAECPSRKWQRRRDDWLRVTGLRFHSRTHGRRTTRGEFGDLGPGKAGPRVFPGGGRGGGRPGGGGRGRSRSPRR